MCVELENITAEECGEAGGGVTYLYLLYAKDIETFPAFDAAPADNVMTTNIIPKTGKYAKRWEFDEDTCKIDFPSVGTQGALSLEAIIELDLSKMTPAKSRLLDSSLNGKFILFVKDGTNSLPYLIGDPNGRTARRQPSTSSSGTALADKNHDKVIFKCSIGKRKYYGGTIPLAPNGG